MEETQKSYSKKDLESMSIIDIIRLVSESPELVSMEGLDYAQDLIVKTLDVTNEYMTKYAKAIIDTLPMLTAAMNAQEDIEIEIGVKKICHFDSDSVSNIALALISVMDTIRRFKGVEEKEDDVIIRYQLQKLIEEYVGEPIIDL